MLVEVTADFNKDISKLRDKKLLLAVKAALQRIEAAHDMSDVPNLIKNAGKHRTSSD